MIPCHGSLMISKEENPKVFRKQTNKGVSKGRPSKMGTILLQLQT